MRHVPLRKPEQGGTVQSQGRGRRWQTTLLVCAATAGLVAAAEPAMASSAPAAPPANSFTKTNLISNTSSHHANLVDPNLQNAWGITAGPTTPIWVSDNNSGNATVYSGGVSGSKVTLDLTVPTPGGNPTGQVFNSAKAFPVGGASGSPAVFIVDSDSIGSVQSPGQIEAWNGGAQFTVEDSPTGGAAGMTPVGAVFKGLAIASTTANGPELFAADVANGTVDVFDSNFMSVSTPTEFQDPKLPAGYVPFGIQNLGNKIYVSYGKQNATKTDVVPGSGFGVVDVYSVNGKLLHHLVSNGPSSALNEPWGLAIAPAGFGPFAGDLLVGNLGNGWINAYNPTTGKWLGTLDNSTGYPLTIHGLWGLMVGNSAFGGASSVVFSAGPSGYNDGSVGILNPAS
jgi:uncharacterized protein (TIGR03118 family)